MLERITAVLERARVAGGWIDEDVARAVLTEMREASDAMVEGARASQDVPYDHYITTDHFPAIYRAMIDGAIAENPAPE